MRVIHWVCGFIRFINRNPHISREIEYCNQNVKYNERFAKADRRMRAR